MKKIIKDDEDELIIEVSSQFIKLIGLGALFFFSFPVLRAFLHNPLPKDRLIGFVGAAGTCGLAYLAAYEEGLFKFDSRTRLLTWRRKRSLSTRQGTVSFDQIEQVTLEPISKLF